MLHLHGQMDKNCTADLAGVKSMYNNLAHINCEENHRDFIVN